MADEADVANDYAERFLQAQLEEHQYQLTHAVSAYPLGECRYCAEKLDDGRPYCDENCRDDHWHRLRASKRNGKYRGG